MRAAMSAGLDASRINRPAAGGSVFDRLRLALVGLFLVGATLALGH